MVTLRIKYTKENYMKFLGHLELMKLFERVFRRHKYPLKFSEGFNPHPKMTFASPLSVGYSSKCEIMEVALTRELTIEEVKRTVFPDGIKILDALYVDTKKSLMGSIDASEYFINVATDQVPETVEDSLGQFLSQDHIFYEKLNKKGKAREVDAKSQINSASIIYKDAKEFTLRCDLQTNSQGNLNPELFVKLFFEFMGKQEDQFSVEVERINMFDENHNPLFMMS